MQPTDKRRIGCADFRRTLRMDWRGFLKAATLGAASLSLPELLRAEANSGGACRLNTSMARAGPSPFCHPAHRSTSCSDSPAADGHGLTPFRLGFKRPGRKRTRNNPGLTTIGNGRWPQAQGLFKLWTKCKSGFATSCASLRSKSA